MLNLLLVFSAMAQETDIAAVPAPDELRCQLIITRDFLALQRQLELQVIEQLMLADPLNRRQRKAVKAGLETAIASVAHTDQQSTTVIGRLAALETEFYLANPSLELRPLSLHVCINAIPSDEPQGLVLDRS
ncbi:MAG: hypothetical protein WAZ14_00320 [Patescibacteria group bacterium]